MHALNLGHHAHVRQGESHHLFLWWVNGLRQMSEHVRCASAVWPIPGLRARAPDIPTKRSSHARC